MSTHTQNIQAIDRQFNTIQGIAQQNGLTLVQPFDDAMRPTIGKDDLIAIDTTVNRYRGAGVYVIQVEGTTSMVRMDRFLNEQLSISYDNPLYKGFMAHYDDIQVVGKAVKLFNISIKDM